MNNIFEIVDKTERKIRLTKTQFRHIICHKGMENEIEKIKETLITPLRIDSHKTGELYDYSRYYKDRQKKAKFLQVVVKYLNGEGFVITAYFVRNI